MSVHKTILVTGGAGYIGSACAAALLDEGHSVVVFDVKTDHTYVDARAVYMQGDVTSLSDLHNVCSKHSFTTIIHCAGLKSVPEGEKQPDRYTQVNVGGTQNVLTVMEEYQIPHIIFSSTAAVYSTTTSGICSEDTAVTAPNIYGKTKIEAEKLIKEFTSDGRIRNYTIFRYFNVAGDIGIHYFDPNAQNIFPLIATVVGDETAVFKIFGDDYDTKDGTGVRDYVHIDDIVDAHLLALVTEESNVFNLGTERGYSVKELVAAFESSTNKKIRTETVARRVGDVAVCLADVTKAKKILGWEAKKTLADMVTSTVAVYTSHE